MTVPRFYHSGELIPGREIILEAAAAHHATRVLRLKPGDAMVLFNGQGGEYPVRINGIVKTHVTVLTGEWQNIERESPLQILLAQAISSADKMDLTVQKAVELGVGAIYPIATQRSVTRLSGERALKRVEHWRKVAIHACEQCGRNRIPQIGEMTPLEDFLGKAKTDALRLMLSPDGGTPLKRLKPQPTVVLLVGAEGGFTAEEEQRSRASGFEPVALGRRILRTETAGIAALAAMQTLWGDF